jgi:hypothetical protein
MLPPEPALGLAPPLPPLDEVPALLSFGWPASPSGWVFRSLFAKQPATAMAAEQTAPFHHTPRRCMPGFSHEVVERVLSFRHGLPSKPASFARMWVSSVSRPSPLWCAAGQSSQRAVPEITQQKTRKVTGE